MEKQLKFHNMLDCFDCPIRRLKLEYGRPCFKDYLADDWKLDYCCCEKINEEYFWCGGFCEDTKNPIEQVTQPINSRKTGINYRRIQKIRKNDRLLKIVVGRYIPHAGYVSWEFEGKTLYHSGEYIKYPKGSRAQKLLKTQANRLVRKKSNIRNGNLYRKYFEYQYSLY